METKDLLTEKRLSQLSEMVAEISTAELSEKIENGEIFKLLEISDADDFAAGHIKGAMHVTLDRVREAALSQFRKYQQIVVYCQESNSSVARVAALQLQRAGFTNVLVLKGGKEAWKQAELMLVE